MFTRERRVARGVSDRAQNQRGEVNSPSPGDDHRLDDLRLCDASCTEHALQRGRLEGRVHRSSEDRRRSDCFQSASWRARICLAASPRSTTSPPRRCGPRLPQR